MVDSHTHRLRGDVLDVGQEFPANRSALIWDSTRNLFVPRALSTADLSDASALVDWSGSLVLDQGGTVTATVAWATYQRIGKTCTAWFQLTVTGAGAAASPVRVSRPLTGVTIAGSGEIVSLGDAYTLDASGPTQLAVDVIMLTNETTWVRFLRPDQAALNYFGADPSFALAAGDKLAGSFRYPLP